MIMMGMLIGMFRVYVYDYGLVMINDYGCDRSRSQYCIDLVRMNVGRDDGQHGDGYDDGDGDGNDDDGRSPRRQGRCWMRR